MQDRPERYTLCNCPANKIQEVCRFQWKDLLYEFSCLCFGLSQAALVFTKLLKVPISLLRKLNVKMTIYLDNILLMASSLGDLLTTRDILIFIPQNLGFQTNIKTSYLQPTLTLKFLGMTVDSGGMTLSYLKEYRNSSKYRIIARKFQKGIK